MLQDFWSVSDYFTTLRSKGLIRDSYITWSTRFVSLKLWVEFPIFGSLSFLLKFSKNLLEEKLFKLRKSILWERQFSSIVTFSTY